MEFHFDGYWDSRYHLVDPASVCFEEYNYPASSKWLSHILSTITRLGEPFWMFVGDSVLIIQYYL